MSAAVRRKKSKSVRRAYEKFSADEKAAIGKRAAEHNVSATIRHFLKIYPDRPLKESTIRGWKNQYNREVVRLKNSGKEVVVRELIDNKRGCHCCWVRRWMYRFEHTSASCVQTVALIVIVTGQGIVRL